MCIVGTQWVNVAIFIIIDCGWSIFRSFVKYQDEVWEHFSKWKDHFLYLKQSTPMHVS